MIEDKVDLFSVCRVTREYNQQTRLIRLADIEDGCLKKPIFLKSEPRIFYNRDNLYYKNGPDEEDFIGVWHWTAVPNASSYGSDYIETNFQPDIIPIEIIRLADISSDEEIILELQVGLESEKLPCRFLVCGKAENNLRIGLLCTSKDFQYSDGKYALDPKVVFLKKYKIDGSDLIHIEGRFFHRLINLGESKDRVFTKNKNEIIKDLILTRASWQTLKARGKSKAQWNEFRDFVKSISDENLFQEIEKVMGCTTEEAKRYLSDFFKLEEDVLESQEIEDSILSELVVRNPELMVRCSALVSEKWEKDNSVKIEDANKELQTIKTLLEEKKEEHKNIQTQIQQIQSQILLSQNKLVSIQGEIAEQEQLAEQITIKVQEKIERAKRNTADFVSELMFSSAFSDKSVVHEIADKNEDEKKLYIPGRTGATDDFDLNSDWNEVLQTITAELPAAGVKDKMEGPLAALLYAAFFNKIPVMLLGPCGNDIADALSISITGKLAGRLKCFGEVDLDAIQSMHNADDEIVIIENPLQGRWFESLCDELIARRRLYIVTYPYAEDIVIEPKGIFNYMIPILTEMLVNRFPSRKFIGGKCTEEFKKYVQVKRKNRYLDLMKKMRVSLFSNYMIQTLLTDFHELIKSDNEDFDYISVLFSYAFCTGCINAFMQEILSNTGIDSKYRSRMINFIGESE